MKLVGGGKRSIVIQFVADTVKAARDIDNLTKKMDRARAASGRGGMTGGFSSWDNNWYKNAFAPHGWQQSLISRTRGPVIPRDRNADFLARRRAELGIGKLGESAEGASGSIMGMIGKFGKMAGVLGVVVLGLTMMAKALNATLGPILHHGNLIEGNLIQMEVLLGNQRRANDMMREAIRFSMLTPFTPEETFGAVTASLQYNIDPFKKGAYGLGQNQNVMQILSGLGSFRDIHGQALGVERAAHAVMRGDYRLLRPYRGIVQPAFETAKKAGHVGTPAFTQKFIEELGKIPQIMAMAERHSNSMAGMWSTIKGFAEEFWIAISGAGEMAGVTTFWSYLKSIVMDIRDYGLQFMDYIRPGLTEIGAFLGSIFGFIWDMLKAIGKLIAPVLVPAIKIIWQLLKVILSFIIGTLKVVSQLVGLFVDIISLFIGAIFDISGFTNFLTKFISEIIEFGTGIQMFFQMLNIYIGGVAKRIVAAFREMLQALKDWILDSEVFGKTIREWLVLLNSGKRRGAERAVSQAQLNLSTAQLNYDFQVARHRAGNASLEDVNRALVVLNQRKSEMTAAQTTLRSLQTDEERSIEEARATTRGNREAEQRGRESRDANRRRTMDENIRILEGRFRRETNPERKKRLEDIIRSAREERERLFGFNNGGNINNYFIPQVDPESNDNLNAQAGYTPA